MKSKLKFTFLMSVILVLLVRCTKKENLEVQQEITKAELGKIIFFDRSLSNPIGQSCASCHASNFAFTDPKHSIISQGISGRLFGNRNAPTVSYAMFAPPLYYDNVDSTYVGGQFWDGRVNSLEEQAKKPFFNPLEMNVSDLNMFVTKVKSATFYLAFTKIYGANDDQNELLDNIADAIATFERSDEVNPFTSKFDYYLKGEAALTTLENEGMQLFKDENKGMCAKCHMIEPDPRSGKILFTDFTYDNIGVPRNRLNPFYGMKTQYNPDGSSFVDLGLAKTTNSAINNGQFKVPTLRNVELTAPYFHNGVFGTLEEVVHFYNQRDVDPSMAPPEIEENINNEELGDLKLSVAEEKAIVAFLKTLTDGYK